MFYELENQFSHFGKASGIDIELFVNAATDDSHLDEIEDVLHKLRLSPEATSLLASTQHAFIRLMLAYNSVDELIRILDDRLNYGIFMDDYCCILLMNKLLKENRYKDAARIATIQMIQEDFSHPIVKYMALFACHKYLSNPVPWAPEQPEPEKANNGDEEEEEEIKLRVRFVRNPYFDDHFDLRKPSHLIGKTFWMIGNEMPDILGRSYTLLGYTLHEKWDKLINHIKCLFTLTEKPVVYKDSIGLVRKILDDISNEKKEDSEFNRCREEIDGLLSKLEKSELISDDNFLRATEDKMKEAINEFEEKTIEQQKKVSRLLY